MKTIKQLSRFALDANKKIAIKGGGVRIHSTINGDGTVTETRYDDVNGNGQFDGGDKIISVRTYPLTDSQPPIG
ncbi:hypothetical protein [Chryseobacterium sp. YR221]|uniref:hypothetical protein n=1 Tax=Chryseobacterium sp. YR221 TaxID=1500293 RepID=UPI0009D87545|nr:hypothetical protein [Chryseobacterium sp. YR221]SMC38261.1 hypothetical protein SAMN02787074_0808 [Chryseobacterium sp. YR221]